MNIQTLAFTDGYGREQAIHACGHCGTWFEGDRGRTHAEECCTDIVHHCAECGASLGGRVFWFPLCSKHERRRRIIADVERAKIVEPTTRMYAEPDGGTFFSNIEDRIADREGLFCHPCKEAPFRKGARDDMEGVEELRAFVEAWAAKQTVMRHFPIFDEVVILRPEITSREALIEAVKARWAEEDAAERADAALEKEER